MVIYQVYARSFCDHNRDGVGDLPGITHKLPYLKSLGVEAVWVSPFFVSPMHDFGYDVADHRAVDPLFGSMDDFDALLAKAKSLGLGIVLDMVLSHTSKHHRWFNESRARRDGKDDWYVWADARADGSPPNNWCSVFGGPAWRWDAMRRQYYLHQFLDSQPDLNLHHPAVQDQLLADIEFWLAKGVAGVRLDACNHYFHDRKLRDNPPAQRTHAPLHPYGFQKHKYDKNRPEVGDFLARIRTLLDRYDAFSIGEVGGTGALRFMAEYTRPGRLHSVYNRDFLRPECDVKGIRRVLAQLERKVPNADAICHSLSNHDKPRVVTRWGVGKDPLAHAKQMLALLACFKGHVCLYQGEELGLPEAEVPFESLQDPFGKHLWPQFKGRDGCRTPMPWTTAADVGFSVAMPWLPVDPRHRVLAVEAQEDDPDSVLHFARRILALRAARPELRTGTLALPRAPADVLSIVRSTGNSTMRCDFNLGLGERRVRSGSAVVTLLEQGARSEDQSVVLQPSGFRLAVVNSTIAAPPAVPPAAATGESKRGAGLVDAVE